MSGRHSEKRGLSGPGGHVRESSRGGGHWTPPYQERCVDPPDASAPKGAAHKAQHQDANGKEAEIQEFLPTAAESASAACACAPCVSVAACRRMACSVLTCGLYRTCRRVPCLGPGSGSADELKAVRPAAPRSPSRSETESDFRIRGEKVVGPLPVMDDVVFVGPSKAESARPSVPHPLDSLYWDDDPEDTCGDVDSLIARKLLDLYSLIQIEELARCTSDSVFLKRTSEISQLIADVVKQHNLEEQDAECRVVHGIIRLSTRKSRHRPPGRRLDTPPDSGNDTMRPSASVTDSNCNDLEISKETSEDVRARNMRHNSGQAQSSGSPTTFSPAYRDTDTDSSGLPLLARCRQT
ncbi:keratinocyte differentiation factor 1 [Denticeps clupeoides]|uniref:Keratinocyte differentiation factor 1 n=1 Tax=Denticeps clupeoides TaxID=299321 RepID=A0AAY4BG03_9TELE|nr:keratinocyte differentiation factor 1-like [Denticeps clupeoides]XP_028820339.1 keratinocyte differentiation factor 1-like [Denticeps clupeoides]XP_028820340.1 keratinocyte differentiation factor 1-like [Denticeps clupeoides]XP_028820341.1 keratinocyte differentiation factor 1-like [Denticeps clupeoides]